LQILHRNVRRPHTSIAYKLHKNFFPREIEVKPYRYSLGALRQATKLILSAWLIEMSMRFIAETKIKNTQTPFQENLKLSHINIARHARSEHFHRLSDAHRHVS
jgi:hypothetical protein